MKQDVFDVVFPQQKDALHKQVSIQGETNVI
jgi:hypothetical protein